MSVWLTSLDKPASSEGVYTSEFNRRLAAVVTDENYQAQEALTMRAFDTVVANRILGEAGMLPMEEIRQSDIEQLIAQEQVAVERHRVAGALSGRWRRTTRAAEVVEGVTSSS